MLCCGEVTNRVPCSRSAPWAFFSAPSQPGPTCALILFWFNEAFGACGRCHQTPFESLRPSLFPCGMVGFICQCLKALLGATQASLIHVKSTTGMLAIKTSQSSPQPMSAFCVNVPASCPGVDGSESCVSHHSQWEWAGGVLVNIYQRFSGGKETWFLVFADFHDANLSQHGSFQLLCGITEWSWEEMHTVSRSEKIQFTCDQILISMTSCLPFLVSFHLSFWNLWTPHISTFHSNSCLRPTSGKTQPA